MSGKQKMRVIYVTTCGTKYVCGAALRVCPKQTSGNQLENIRKIPLLRCDQRGSDISRILFDFHKSTT